MKTLTIKFDFDNCNVCIKSDNKRVDGLPSESRLKYLVDLSNSIGRVKSSKTNDVDKTINLVLAQETMLQFVSCASFIDTRCYEMQVKVTDRLRESKSEQTFNNI